MLSLHSEKIDLWVVLHKEICDSDQLNQYKKILSEEEKNKGESFYFLKDKHRYFITRALVRFVLSRYAPVKHEEWLFGKNFYGKPTIENSDASVSNLSFNISHTSGLIVLAVTSRSLLGIDAENIVVRPAPLEIAEQYFTSSEASNLKAQPAHLRQEYFFKLWTLKESYIKARGMGLSIPLSEFGFSLGGKEKLIDFSVSPELDDRASRWNFWQLGLRDEYLISVCAERTCPSPQNFTVRKIVPFGREEPLEVKWIERLHQ